MEYFIILATVAASLSVPVFANSILAATSTDSDISAPQPSTVKTLGTISRDDLTNATRGKAAARDNAADTSDAPLQPTQVNGITYITGGIGDEERAKLESEKHNYNLHITSAGKAGEYVGDTRIVIRDRKGNELLNVSSGPLFYVQLPAGAYTIEARSDGETQERRVTVGQKNSFLHFSWR